jgi:hypothetical protein
VDLREKFNYCAFYCEENIWKLCQEPEFLGKSAFVVFVSNPQKSCAIWHQQTSESVDQLVVFDYHVFLLAEDEEQGWLVWDLDTTLGFPVRAATYFQDSFSSGYIIPEELNPFFRILSPQDYLDHLSTDRSHMLDENGEWLHPPPQWEAPFTREMGMNLYQFAQIEEGSIAEGFVGEVLDLQTMRQRFV